jgi:hypothetical protein
VTTWERLVCKVCIWGYSCTFRCSSLFLDRSPPQSTQCSIRSKAMADGLLVRLEDIQCCNPCLIRIHGVPDKDVDGLSGKTNPVPSQNCDALRFFFGHKPCQEEKMIGRSHMRELSKLGFWRWHTLDGKLSW